MSKVGCLEESTSPTSPPERQTRARYRRLFSITAVGSVIPPSLFAIAAQNTEIVKPRVLSPVAGKCCSGDQSRGTVDSGTLVEGQSAQERDIPDVLEKRALS